MSDRCLFLGLEAKWDHTLKVVALDHKGQWVLRARFPLLQPNDVDLDFGPAAPIAACLSAFLESHEARTVVGAPDQPAVVVALAYHLGEQVRLLGPRDFASTALDYGSVAADPTFVEFIDALSFALLGALGSALDRELP